MNKLYHQDGNTTFNPGNLTELHFEFGANWRKFLEVIDKDRISCARQSLQDLLVLQHLSGKTFLDVGCGSGLFSLAARQLGATVYSFDYDKQSVNCALELKRRFCLDDPCWRIEHGSILDQEFTQTLPRADIVYAWGVLHHTGSLWKALENTAQLVSSHGLLYVAIYNRQPMMTPFWRQVKRRYNTSSPSVRAVMVWFFHLLFVSAATANDIVHRRNPLDRYRGNRKRGMHMFRDTVDWIGGWPFEVATPEEVLSFVRCCGGFKLFNLKTCGRRHGCNEFVFRRSGEGP